jgi:hypothetical protein
MRELAIATQPLKGPDLWRASASSPAPRPPSARSSAQSVGWSRRIRSSRHAGASLGCVRAPPTPVAPGRVGMNAA